jgi:hypothetical protein
MIQHTISLSLSQETNLSLINTILQFSGHTRSGFAEGLEPGGVMSTIVLLKVSGRGPISPLVSLIFRGRITGRDSIDGWAFIDESMS